MTLRECMRQLGLGDVASVDEIKRAYRRLAQQLHPDKHGGDDAARQRFVDVSKAYRMLIKAARAAQRGKDVGTCRECGAFGEVVTGPDGHPRCELCVFRPVGSRLLPFPILVVAKCVSTFVLLAVSAWLLVLALTTGSKLYAAAAAIAGVIALAVLAYTCLTVIYCLTPRDRRQSQSNRR